MTRDHRQPAPHQRPPLSDVLSDPLTRAVMDADRVDAAELESALVEMSRTLAQMHRPDPRVTRPGRRAASLFAGF